MDRMAIEQYAVDAVRDRINYSEHLSAYVADNDKEPSWDGHIYIYGQKKNCDHQIGRIPVQVKGSEKNDLSLDKIQFRINLSHLHSYLSDGGCLLFVVYIQQDKKAMKTNQQIYYRELTPIRLQEILAGAKKNAKSTNVTLLRMPDTVEDMERMVHDCYENCKKQASFAGNPLPTIDRLEREGILEKIVVPFHRYDQAQSPEEAFLTCDSYAYAKVRGIETLLPLAGVMNYKVLSSNRSVDVSVKGKVYYNSCTLVESSEDITFHIGKSTSMIITKASNSCVVNFRVPKMLNDYLLDQRFILDALLNNGFEIRGVSICFSSQNSTLANINHAEQERRLDFYKKTKSMLTAMHCDDNLDLTALTQQDLQNLDCLVRSLVEMQPITGLSCTDSSLRYFRVGPLNFLVFVQRINDEQCTICSLEDAAVLYGIKESEEPMVLLPKYGVLQKNDFITACNLPFGRMLSAFQDHEKSEYLYIAANYFLLKLIAAYDEANGIRKNILFETATQFAEWLSSLPSDQWDHQIATINRLQLVKRKRELTQSERNELFEIISTAADKPFLLTGLYLLLGEQIQARKYFNQMTEIDQKEFASFPINKFWEE